MAGNCDSKEILDADLMALSLRKGQLEVEGQRAKGDILWRLTEDFGCHYGELSILREEEMVDDPSVTGEELYASNQEDIPDPILGIYGKEVGKFALLSRERLN